VISTVKWAWGIVLSSWNYYTVVLPQQISSMWSSIKSFFTSGWSNVTSGVSNAWNSIKSYFSSGFTNVTNNVINAWNGIKSYFSNGASSAKSTVSNMIENIKSFFHNLPSQFSSFGRDMIQGFINGVMGMAGTLASKVKNMIDNAVPAPVKKLLGIASPSKLFKQYGAWTIEGFGIGAEGEQGALQKSMANIFDSIGGAQEIPVSFNTSALNGALNQSALSQVSMVSTTQKQNTVHITLDGDLAPLVQKVETKVSGNLSNIIGGRLI
jgi:phage-related protein